VNSKKICEPFNMQNQKKRKKTSVKLVNSTVLMAMSLVYLMTICWVVPFGPMIIVWMFDLPFTSFMIIWSSGLPFLSLAWYYFLKG